MSRPPTAPAPLPPHALDLLLSAEAVQARIDALADELAPLAPPGPVRVVALLNGAFVFAADLGRALEARGVPLWIDLVRASSYGDHTESQGRVEVESARLPTFSGEEVWLLDDILDTGRTLATLRAALGAAGAGQVRAIVLLDKPSRREVPVEADHVGFSIPDTFVVGYGLDWAGRYRALPDISAVRFHG
jgi:hypoxanthine phosphoribosyltransferase